jgi:hypothetical protein
VGDGDRGDAGLPGRQPADDVGLVAAAAEHVRPQPAQVAGHLARRPPEVWRVVRQFHRFKALAPGLGQEGPAQAPLGGGQERGAVGGGQARRQAQDLALGSPEEGGGHQVDDGPRLTARAGLTRQFPFRHPELSGQVAEAPGLLPRADDPEHRRLGQPGQGPQGDVDALGLDELGDGHENELPRPHQETVADRPAHYDVGLEPLRVDEVEEVGDVGPGPLAGEAVGDEPADADDLRVTLEQEALDGPLQPAAGRPDRQEARVMVGEVVAYPRRQQRQQPEVAVAQRGREVPVDHLDAVGGDQAQQAPAG